jgi:putative ABC transport system permease protein
LDAREIFRLALKLIVRTPGRSALTMLGLAIGVGAFIAMVSFGEGARRSVIAQFELLGTTMLKIQSAAPALAPGSRPPAPLSDADVTALRREATTLARVSPVLRRSVVVAHGGEQHSTNAYGVDAEYLRIHAWPPVEGGGFDAIDLEQRAKICLLGTTPERELFGDRDALGATVTVAGKLPCRVVGVLSTKGHSTAGNDLDDVVMLPLTTFGTHLSDRPGYERLEAEPLSASLLDAALAETAEILRRSHRLEANEPNDFSVSSPLEVIRAADRTSKILSTLLAAIAAVSLLVGGIGIMNIQLVSVAERTEEIGVRAAIGASPTQILAQFLVEALLLTVIGTLLGVATGIGVASVVAEVMAWPRVISPFGVALSTTFGLAVGTGFGYLPARRAARMDPIHALRRE